MSVCPTCHRPLTYMVKSGDTLSAIAAKVWPNDPRDWRDLAKANLLRSADFILPGQILTIPL